MVLVCFGLPLGGRHSNQLYYYYVTENAMNNTNIVKAVT